MARPINTRPVPMMQLPEGMEVVPDFVTFWNEPQGIDLVTPLNRLGNNKTPFANNFRMDIANRLLVRAGYAIVGAAASAEIVGLVVASTQEGVEYVVRVTTSGVDILGSSAWAALSGPVLGLPDYAEVEFVAWGGSKLLFVDGINGMWVIDLIEQTYTLDPTAPIGKHITVFGGRVIISNILNEPTRLQWSVRNDYSDWAGIGSGFEDLLSSPGGIVDIQHGVFPVTDIEAFIVRSGSIWVATQTGNPDAPFLFNYRFNEGTDSPKSIVRLPGAQLMMLGREDVVAVSTSQIQRMGTFIRSALISTSLLVRNAKAAWDNEKSEYRLQVPNSNYIWRYHTPSNTWLRDEVPFTVKQLAAGNLLRVLSIGELTGTIGDLTGPIGDLGVLGRTPGMYVAADNGYVMREQTGTNADQETDGGTTPIVAIIASGIVLPAGPLNRSSVVSVNLELITTRAITIYIETSEDGGTSWDPYGTILTTASASSQILAYRYTINRAQYQFRLRSLDAAGLTVISAHVSALAGAPRII